MSLSHTTSSTTPRRSGEREIDWKVERGVLGCVRGVQSALRKRASVAVWLSRVTTTKLQTRIRKPTLQKNKLLTDHSSPLGSSASTSEHPRTCSLRMTTGGLPWTRHQGQVARCAGPARAESRDPRKPRGRLERSELSSFPLLGGGDGRGWEWLRC